jgi:hypothetical protein
MQRVILLSILAACLLAPTVMLAQSSLDEQTTNSPVKEYRFNIGFGYKFKNGNNTIKPFEMDFQYNLSNRHQFYIDIPLYINNINDKNISELNDNNFIYNEKYKRLWGLEAGYDYNFVHDKLINLFLGMGLSYIHQQEKERLNHLYENKLTYEDITDRSHNYHITPEAGINIRLGHIKAEVKYKYYIGKCHSKFIVDPSGKDYQLYKSRKDDWNSHFHSLTTSLYYMF